jgi:hypothetical protein
VREFHTLLRTELLCPRFLAPLEAPSAGRAPAFTAELDPELQAYAEAAIQTFRSSFEATLTGNSPVMRERLRQAASNLMRAAARTTIVLDRLNTDAKRRVQ